MKLQALSDLHCEFESFDFNETNADVVVLAGDTNIKQRGLDWALSSIKDKPVIYLIGNHEYYTAAYPKLVSKLKEKCEGTNVHVLENDKISIDGVNIFGCTLWTNFKLFGDPRIAGYECQQIMSDYKKIRISPKFSKLRSIDVASIHSRSIRWLESELKKCDGEKNVVVTHHAPSAKSIPEHLVSEISSAAYASDLEEYVEASGAVLWVHGHIHKSSDYFLGECRVVCNPRGYPDEPNPSFDSKLVIDV